MRILIISSYYPPFELGGWPQLTYDLAEKLKERGHEIRILTSRFRMESIQEPEPGVFRELHLESPDFEHYHPSYTLLANFWEHQNRRIIRDMFSEFVPDVVFIHGLWNMSRGVAVEAEKLKGDRIVYYMASTWPTLPDAHTAYWSSPASNHWVKPFKFTVGSIAKNTILKWGQPPTPRFERVLCVSAFIKKYMHEEVGVPNDAMQVVHNGIDARMFVPRQLQSQPGDPLKLLYAGGLWAHKGVPTAIEAMGVLINKIGIKDVHLTLVGSGHPDYVQILKELIENNNLNEFVSFGTRVARNEMPELLRQFDVLIFPSTGPEALARMVQEAMACGLVVIGSNTGGTPEIIFDGETGLLFEAGDAQVLAEKIAILAKDRALQDRLAHGGRKIVEERFTIERMAYEVERFLEVVCNHLTGSDEVAEINRKPAGIKV